MNSVYSKILKSILLVFIMGWLIVVILTRSETAHEIEELFDAQLSQDAGIIFDTSINAIQQNILLSKVLPKTHFGHKYENKISFQIWNGDEMLFRSRNAPNTKFSSRNGYTDVTYKQKKWRVFATLKNFGLVNYTIITAEEHEIRNELLNEILLRSIAPLIVALPFLIFFLHLAIKSGLSPIQEVASKVESKNTMDFSPVQVDRVPKEIQVVIVALNKLLKRLKVSFDKERRFTMNAAHELRTPIAALQVQAQVAKGSIDNKVQLTNAIEKILIGTQKSAHLIGQMLTLARLEPEAIKNKFIKTDIIYMIKESIAENVILALDKEIEVEFECEPESGCVLLHYPQGIGIMINNLLQNAIRYTPQQGNIIISVLCEEKSCTIKVKDNGTGISVEDMDKVMERYYRANQSDNGGCGLGFSIIKQIVEIHDGNIDLESNNGLTVTISLPVI